MQLTINNGTLIEFNETITPNEGYMLPSDILVSGATKGYNNETGAIQLTNLTDTIHITASGINNYSIGNKAVINSSVGNKRVVEVEVDNVLIYKDYKKCLITNDSDQTISMYDGASSVGLATQISAGDSTSILCKSGNLFFDVEGGLVNVSGSNGATSSNPSSISEDTATITLSVTSV